MNDVNANVIYCNYEIVILLLVMKKRTVKKNQSRKAWVLTVDMGYGHQRAAYPMEDIAFEGVIAVNDYKGLPKEERETWHRSREGYEWISRVQSRSFIGRTLFNLFDKIQEIPHFYPRRDLSRPNLQLLHTYDLIERQGICRDLFMRVLKKNNTIPLYCTFFIPAFAAEMYDYPGEIYLQVCDADVSRSWVPRHPGKSRIKYCAPNRRVVERLREYGVKPENIFFTGFPLPKENVGGLEMKTLREDIGARIYNLDPRKMMTHKFGHIITYHLGGQKLVKKATHPLTLTFAVGGAGAQRDLGVAIVNSLKEKILKKQICLNLIAGTRPDVAEFFKGVIKEAGLNAQLGKHINILFEKTKHEYFVAFNQVLRTTDVLWTKPSELSFYAGLGIPLIMAPSLGSQEDFNRVWLKTIGAGISQDDPHYTHEWLFDWIESGWLARAALNGFSEAPVLGTYTVEKLVTEGPDHVGMMDKKSPMAW